MVYVHGFIFYIMRFGYYKGKAMIGDIIIRLFIGLVIFIYIWAIFILSPEMIEITIDALKLWKGLL